jgi:hypothetical protein
MNSQSAQSIEQATIGEGSTALHLAVHCGNREMIKRLVQACPRLAILADKHGQTPLHWVAAKNHAEEGQWINTLKLLTQIMKDHDETSLKLKTHITGYTALHLAIHSENTQMIEWLLQECCELANINDNYGQSALFWIADMRLLEEETWQRIVSGLLAVIKDPQALQNAQGLANARGHQWLTTLIQNKIGSL